MKTKGERKTVSSDREFVYCQLKGAIVKGEIKPNERIVETAYAELFNVSRTPVREALRMLERDGLVNYAPKKGAMARAPLTQEEVAEIFSIRAVLQMYSAESTVKNVTDQELEEMRLCNERCQQAWDSEDKDSFFRYHDKFNGLLMQGSGMPMLIKLLDELETFDPITAFAKENREHPLMDPREIALPSRKRRYEAITEHEDIRKALAQRDLQAYRKALQYHLDKVAESCIQGIVAYRMKLED